ncbi:LysR substrate-binding domain-containing protein [Variovorax sp. UC122_21]|uniref:LysR substrate-binding domain-containing protein n=1 Tax=Variovorax sp. UC122_21 TaxID=3374554 RepID=UPI0037583B94
MWGEPVNISCSPSLAMLWLTLRLGSLYRANPDMAFRVVGESDRVDPSRMSREGIAAAVRLGAAGSEDAKAVDLLDEWLVPVAAPSFMQAHPELRKASKLKGSQLLHAADPGEGGEPTEEWAQWLGAVGMDLAPSALRQGTQFNLSLLAVQAALGGQGIAMGRLALVLHYLTSGRLVLAFPSGCFPTRRTASSAALPIPPRRPCWPGCSTRRRVSASSAMPTSRARASRRPRSAAPARA